MHPREIEREIPKYEGLTFTTAALIVGIGRQAGIASQVDLDLDEIQQRLRLKVWMALRSYRRELSRGRTDERLRRYVFSCLMNEKKDIFKSWGTAVARNRRGHLYIEDQCYGDGEHNDGFDFEAAHLSVSADAVFGEVEDHLTLPNTLDPIERQVVLLLYSGRSRAEIHVVLDLSAKRVDELVRLVREKLADWRPSPRPPRPPAPAAPPSLLVAPGPARPRLRPAGHAATAPQTRRRAAA